MKLKLLMLFYYNWVQKKKVHLKAGSQAINFIFDIFLLTKIKCKDDKYNFITKYIMK